MLFLLFSVHIFYAYVTIINLFFLQERKYVYIVYSNVFVVGEWLYKYCVRLIFCVAGGEENIMPFGIVRFLFIIVMRK